MKDKAKLEDEKTKKEADEKDIKGVPDFWLTIFKVPNYSQVFYINYIPYFFEVKL